jgi:tetratricopeptide (TPR) repeat protein
LWQSECFLKGGATCTACHTNVHDPQIEKNNALRPGANAICTTCHSVIAQNVTAHSHHKSDSAGSACVECHMPRTVFSIKAAIRDHSISIPVPENTLRHGIPNACNVCHQNRDANWTLSRMKDWYGDASRQKLIGRASAFSLARAGDHKAIGPLLAILDDPSEGAVVRANAAGHLSKFSDDGQAIAALKRALKDKEPLVRAVAAQRIASKNSSPEVSAALIQALSDPSRAVREGAVLSLVNLGVERPSGDDGRHFDLAAQEYLARAAVQADDGPEQFNAGSMYLFTGKTQQAIGAFQSALRLDRQVPAAYGLACAYVQAGRVDDAIRTLRAIPTKDPYYAPAQRLLVAVLRSTNSGTAAR